MLQIVFFFLGGGGGGTHERCRQVSGFVPVVIARPVPTNDLTSGNFGR